MKTYKLQITFNVPDEKISDGFDLCEDSNEHVINILSDYIEGNDRFEDIEVDMEMTETPTYPLEVDTEGESHD